MSENGAENFKMAKQMNAMLMEEISITVIILEVLCMVAAPCSSSSDKAQIVCVWC
jgi:hypothetical protein